MLQASRVPKFLGDASSGGNSYQNGSSGWMSGGSGHRMGYRRQGDHAMSQGAKGAIAGGILTALTFGAAFKLAKTERAWTPGIFLGGLVALAGLAACHSQAYGGDGGGYSSGGGSNGSYSNGAAPVAVAVVPVDTSAADAASSVAASSNTDSSGTIVIAPSSGFGWY